MIGKSFVLAAALLAFSVNITAQEDLVKKDSTWVFTANTSVNFSNVGLSNWSGGGNSSIAIGGVFDGKASKETEKNFLIQSIALNFGVARLGGRGNLFKKTDDQFLLETRYGCKFLKHWSFFSDITIRSQFIAGYNYGIDSEGNEFEDERISNFLAPGYINKGVGVQYKNSIISMGIAPFTGKTTLVLDEELSSQGAFGVAPGDYARFELGMNFNAQLEAKILQNTSFKSNLNLFSNYQNPDKVDVNWETLLELKVNKYITTNFGTTLIYDHDVLIPQENERLSRKVQFRHVLNLNFGYKFDF